MVPNLASFGSSVGLGSICDNIGIPVAIIQTPKSLVFSIWESPYLQITSRTAAGEDLPKKNKLQGYLGAELSGFGFRWLGLRGSRFKGLGLRA